MIEQILVALYLLVTLGFGLYKRASSDVDSYLFAGRKLTIPAFVATIVTTWYGGILEIGRFSFENGIVTWIIFGVFYYFAALLFIKIIAPKIANEKIRTIPEFLNKHYSKSTALFGFIFVILLVSPAPYLKMLAGLFQYLWHIPELTALIIGALCTVIYAISGGFSAVVRTDKFQFVLMFTGFAFILGTVYSKYGGIQFLQENAPAHAFSIPGNISWTYLFVWGFIALVTFIDPGFYQRCFAGNSLRTVQKGIKISVFFWLIFDFLTVFTGIYASAILPSNITGNAYLELATLVLPPISRGLFLVSLFAIVMSTVDSFTFISAYTIGKDLPQILFQKRVDFDAIKFTKISLLITAVISIVIAYFFPHAIDIWYTAGTFAIPVLMVPILTAMYKRPVRYPVLMMLSALTVALVWYLFGLVNMQDGWPVYPLSIEPLYPGLLVSVGWWFITKRFEFIQQSKDGLELKQQK